MYSTHAHGQHQVPVRTRIFQTVYMHLLYLKVLNTVVNRRTDSSNLHFNMHLFKFFVHITFFETDEIAKFIACKDRFSYRSLAGRSHKLIIFKMVACPAFGTSHDIQYGSLHCFLGVDRMILIIQNKMAAYTVLFWKTL